MNQKSDAKGLTMRRQPAVAFLICAVLFVGFGMFGCSRAEPNGPHGIVPGPHDDTYTTEETDYHAPPSEQDDLLADDQLDASRLPAFDPKRIDSRKLGDWEVNASAAVVRLDCPIIKPDSQGDLLILRKSFAEAVGHAPYSVLPSANLADGAAKQFDDGLYAALDLACYKGELGFGISAPDLVLNAFGKLPIDSPARPFLAAALQLSGKQVPLNTKEDAQKEKLLNAFNSDESRSKPISFYTWTPELAQVWQFYRFLQTEFTDDDDVVARPMAVAFGAVPTLLKQYRAIDGFYGHLTNPQMCLSMDALLPNSSIRELAQEKGMRRKSVAVFPPSTSPHAELFEELFPLGLPAGTDLMRTLVRNIRSGDVNLKPGANDGWFQYQAYALETLLVPSRGQERDKLLLSASYKKRLVEAFKALMTKRIETHVRQLAEAKSALAEAPIRPIEELKEVEPRLRIEPCPTFYLRTARAYAFLKNFLAATVGEERLAKLHGLREDGPRGVDLAHELDSMRGRFYGFYLVSCEDLGMATELMPDEHVDSAAATKNALEWLNDTQADPDLARDTRAAVPIFNDYLTGRTRLWATLGVRLAPLEASYAVPPNVRVASSENPWQDVKPEILHTANYVIPVDEFAEFELHGSRVLTRDEFRALCDKYKTKDEILNALANP